MSQTVYFITGANKGIGWGLVTTLLSRPNTTVIAAARNPDSVPAQPSTSESSKLIVVKYDATSLQSLTTATSELTSYGVSHIDVVIANAGASAGFHTVLETPEEDLKADFDVNVLGPLRLYQNLHPLLSKSKRAMFIYISSTLGSIGVLDEESFPSCSYGVSKAAGNFLVKKIHKEEERRGILGVAVHPGWARTDLGKRFAESVGMKEGNLGVEESAKGIVGIIDTATREKIGGKFLLWNGKELPW